MKKYFLLSLMILAAGCDAPQRSRNPINYINGNSLGNTSQTTGGFTNIPMPGTTTGTTTNGSTPGSVVTTPGFESCDLSDKYQTIDIGFFGICQSTQDETAFKFKPSLTSTSVRTCLIPTYKEANGSSTWLGQPQCTYTTSNQVVTGKLYKDRNGFATYPVNGVIVMKEPLLPEYFACMQAFTSWPANVCTVNAQTPYCMFWGPRCPYGGKSNAACDTEARNYMNQLCTTFKTRYSNSYIDIKTR